MAIPNLPRPKNATKKLAKILGVIFLCFVLFFIFMPKAHYHPSTQSTPNDTTAGPTQPTPDNSSAESAKPTPNVSAANGFVDGVKIVTLPNGVKWPISANSLIPDPQGAIFCPDLVTLHSFFSVLAELNMDVLKLPPDKMIQQNNPIPRVLEAAAQARCFVIPPDTTIELVTTVPDPVDNIGQMRIVRLQMSQANNNLVQGFMPAFLEVSSDESDEKQ